MGMQRTVSLKESSQTAAMRSLAEAITGGRHVIHHEFFVQSSSFSQKASIKSAPTHLNLMDLHFLSFMERDEIAFRFFTLCANSDDSFV
jgi:hypothetical protein